MNTLNLLFSDTIYSKRMDFAISQEKMAVKCCMSIRQYVDLESGKRLPSFRTLVNIAINCNISLDDMLEKIVKKGYKVSDDNYSDDNLDN